MTTSPASNATLELNSVVCGAISSVLTKATDAAKASRATRPAGTVFGSVIMKKRKISTSGDVTITHQNREPHTGANDQRAVMQCPEAATTPMPAASVIQNAADISSRCRRRVMSTPPTMMIRYASAIQNTERRPPEVERFHARAAQDQEGRDEADVRRVEHVRAPVLDHVLREQGEPGHDGEQVPAVPAPVVTVLGADHPEDQRDAAPGQHGARRPHERSGAGERPRHFDHGARQDGDEDLHHRHPESEDRLAEDVDRDDDRREMQPGIADGREHERVPLPCRDGRCERGTAFDGRLEPRARGVRAPGRPRRHVRTEPAVPSGAASHSGRSDAADARAVRELAPGS